MCLLRSVPLTSSSPSCAAHNVHLFGQSLERYIMAVRAQHDRLQSSTRLDIVTTMLGPRRSAGDVSKQNARMFGLRHDSLLSSVDDRHSRRLAEQAPVRHDITPRTSRSKSIPFYRHCNYRRRCCGYRLKMLKESSQNQLHHLAVMEFQRERKSCPQCLPPRSSSSKMQARRPQQRHARHVPALPRSSHCTARMASQHFQAQI